MNIDAHQHFWRYAAPQYPWIDDGMAALRRDFLPADLSPLLQSAGFGGSIAVQARQSVLETEWLLELAESHSIIRGVVGWFPLAAPELPKVLDRLMSPHLKGVRHVVQDEPDPAFLDRDDFNAGIRQVAARNLTYDLLIYAHQLPAALRFVDRHPDLRIVIDHIAKPRVEGMPPETWKHALAELARREHVSCKFSGVVTEVPGGRWDSELLRPYWDVLLRTFGADRLMFGSDWPVCLLASSYERWHDFVTACAAALSPAESESFFGGTATRSYQLA